MRRAAFVLLVATLTSVLLQRSVAAGGWWNFISLDGPIGVGESLEHRVEDVTYSTTEQTEAALRVQWYAYLLPGFKTQALDRAMRKAEPGDWWVPPSKAILAGEIDLSNKGSGFLDATVRLTVPDIPTGPYHLMLCDLGCRTPLGDVIPQRVDVAADAFSAQLARKLERKNLRLQETLVRQRRQLRREIRQVERQLVETKLESAKTDEVARLADEVARLRRERPSTPWMAFGGWFVAGAAVSALALVVLRRRKDAASAEGEVSVVRVPDDARELIESS